ncbi:unnamed protein product [Diamesa serratosioi]
MNIPYMKIVIYILTFIGYVYSGYGSGVLSGLRDAILTAETVFGDVFKNFLKVSSKFKTINEIFESAVEENCVYSCPGNYHPTQHKNYKPSSDGCGSLGMSISTEYLPAPEMAKCCDSHDICYDTCNSDKELCDLDFKRCLYKFCDSFDKTSTADLLLKGCKGAAKMLFTGTITLGCKSFLDAQKRSCYCPPVSSSSSQSNTNKKDKTNNNYNGKKPKEKKNYGWKTGDDL